MSNDNTITLPAAAILEKNGIFACLRMDYFSDSKMFVASKYDPRVPHKFFRITLETQESADQHFAHSIFTSRQRGWDVIYFGSPKVG